MDGESFRIMCFLNTELWSSEFIELDVCGRPLFTNLVTNTACIYSIYVLVLFYLCSDKISPQAPVLDSIGVIL